VLVLDAHSSAALAIARSLGRAGYWVAVAGAAGQRNYAALSRFCRMSWTYPSPVEDTRAFLGAVSRLTREQSLSLVVPATDATTWPLVVAWGVRPEGTSLAAAPAAALGVVNDKYRTLELASELGLAVPDTRIASAADGLAVDAIDWGFPVVVKDRYSIRWVDNRGLPGRVAYAYSAGGLRSMVEQRVATAGDVLLQRFTPGVGIGYSCLVVKGRCLLPFQWRRIREKDPRGSGSSVRRSVPLDRGIQEDSERLLLSAGFEGLAMVEYKGDPSTGRFTLMEINGRPWGSLQLAIACGIDYPRHLAAWRLQGLVPPAALAYPPGQTCRHLTYDLMHLENVWTGKPEGWPLAYPGFVPTLARVCMPWYPGLHYEDFAAWDLRPGLAQLGDWLKGHLQRRSGRG
jgi:predicted ATP-grasp superfamily ATP-dependent carboligase